jgi:hypothetical protein
MIFPSVKIRGRIFFTCHDIIANPSLSLILTMNLTVLHRPSGVDANKMNLSDYSDRLHQIFDSDNGSSTLVVKVPLHYPSLSILIE